MNVDALVRGYARFLAAAWEAVSTSSPRGSRDDLVGDWRQANWEVLVEGLLPTGTRLVIYDGGADCNGPSSRVFDPAAMPTQAAAVKGRR